MKTIKIKCGLLNYDRLICIEARIVEGEEVIMRVPMMDNETLNEFRERVNKWLEK